MTRVTILKGNIKDELWPKLVLIMTYIKNSRLIKALANDLNLHKAHFYEKPDLSHVQILGSVVYILLYEEERIIKSVKWVRQALRETLVSFNGYMIYKIYIKNQNRVIRVKDL